jgi:CHASE2 domain-containing sensor protein
MNRETLFWTALKLSEPDRSRFIDEACSDESERDWVVGMIAAYHKDDNFLAQSAETQLGESTIVDSPARAAEEVAIPVIPGCEIASELGRGGMGIVYKGIQPGLEREVAVKLLQARVVDNVELAERFHREAKAMAQLAHRHIVAIHDSGQTADGFPYFVMEFVGGEDLHQRIQRGRLVESEALSIGTHICEALAFAHSRGFIHRDIKPQNVLLGTDGSVKVADFGLVKLIENPGLTQEGAVMGTPRYWAPEQSEPTLAANVDHRVDIYALGGTLYHILCGTVPEKQYVAPSVICQCDKRLDIVIERCLATDPERRYATADDLLADLIEIRDVRPLRTRLLVNAMAVVFAGIMAALLAPTPFARRLDAMIQDTWFAMRPPIAVSDDLVLVAITDRCLRADQLGAWPWDRKIHARLIDALGEKGAAAIAFDMFLPENGEGQETVEADKSVAEAATRHGAVLFPDFLDSNAGRIENYAGVADTRVLVAGNVEHTSPAIRESGARPAQCHAERDDLDGKLRHVPLFLIDPGDPAAPRPNLGLALALQMLDADFSWSTGSVGIDLPNGESIPVPVDDVKTMFVNYPKSLDSIPAVSCSALLAGETGIDLKGKGVVVGFTATGLTHVTADKHVTVIDPNTPGVLVNVAIANSVITGQFLREGSRRVSLIAGLFLVGLLALVFLRPRVLTGMAISFACVVLLLGIGYGFMVHGGLVLPLLPGLLVVLIGTAGLVFAMRFGKRAPETKTITASTLTKN